MYRPKRGSRQERTVHRRQRRGYLDFGLRVSTVAFWAAALTFVTLMAAYAFTGAVGTTLSRASGISLLLLTVSSGAITWVELKNNPLDDTELGEWTNKMLFYGLICVIGFIIACLYLPALYFAP